MTLDRNSLTPLYQQLASDLRQRIRSGELTGRIPAIVDLAADYDVSEATVRTAISVLKEDGAVGTSRGPGHVRYTQGLTSATPQVRGKPDLTHARLNL